MDLVPQTLQEPLEQLRSKIHTIIDHWVARFRRGRDPGRAISLRPHYSESYFPSLFFALGPLIDVEETDGEIIVRAELPGMDKDGFSVEVSQNRLFIRGEKRHQSETKDENFYHMECSYGSFSRSIDLPCPVVAEKARAKYRHGVLTLRLPKTERGYRRRITVKAG